MFSNLYAPMHWNYLSNFYKKFCVESTDGMKEDNEIWSFYSYHILLFICFWTGQKCVLMSSHLIQSKYNKIHQLEMLFIGRITMEFFSAHKLFLWSSQKASSSNIFDINVECWIWNFYNSSFLSYTGNRYTHKRTKHFEMQFFITQDIESVKFLISRIYLRVRIISISILQLLPYMSKKN